MSGDIDYIEDGGLDLARSPNPKVVRDRAELGQISTGKKETRAAIRERLGRFGGDRRCSADDQHPARMLSVQ